MGTPRGPEGQSWVSPSILLCWGAGAGSGETGVPPSTPPLPVPYILERHPLSGASQPKGGLRFALLSPPKVGTAGEVHCSRAPRRTAILDEVGVLMEGGASTSGPPAAA